MENERTFVIIKPDAITRGLIGAIISRFENKGYRIVHLEMRQKTRSWCKAHYQYLYGVIYEANEDFMLSAPIIGIIIEGPKAIETVRKMVGATNSTEAAIGTIRGDYSSLPIRYNLVHAADSEEAVKKEIFLFFEE